MNNFHQPGSVQDFVAPMGGVVSGGFYSFNGLICCAAVDAAEGETFAGMICGVFRVVKPGSQAWAHGVAVYLTAGSATTFTTTSGGNTLAGIAAGVVGSGAGEVEGLVLLNGLPAAAV
jgi:predicted RecA/RadA family phage recombinase